MYDEHLIDFISLVKLYKHRKFMSIAHQKDFDNNSTTLTRHLLENKLRYVKTLEAKILRHPYYVNTTETIDTLFKKRENAQGYDKQQLSTQITDLRKTIEY